MRKLILLAGLAAAAGCGDTPAVNPRPLSADEKKAIDAQDKQLDDDERSGAGAAKGKEKR